MADTTYRNLEELPIALRIVDLAKALGISRSAAYRLVHTKQIRSIRVGSAIRIPRAALIAFLESPAV